MKKKHAGGRPRKTIKQVLPENWKELILEYSDQGMSDVEIRREFCVKGHKFKHDLWYALKEREEEFAETLQIGKVLCQAWWERISRKKITHGRGTIFETGSWYANMKNRFGWRDKSEHDLGKGTIDAAFSIAKLLSKGRAEKDARLAAGEDPELVLFGRTNRCIADGTGAASN